MPEESELGFAPPLQSQEESSFGHQDVPKDPESARLQQWEVLRDHEVQSSNDAQQHFEELHAEETETSVQPEVVHTDAPQEAETNTAQLQQDEVLPAPEASKHATDEQPLSSDKQLPSSSRSPGVHFCPQWMLCLHMRIASWQRLQHPSMPLQRPKIALHISMALPIYHCEVAWLSGAH